jgi:lipid II:glycine glycyltransferase (peptidoglycan interpeptide bridge formation enzyme)
MTIHAVNPLKDTRWREFVLKHPRATVFHSMPWLEALRRTYGYEPIVFTTSPPSTELKNALVFCKVRSYLTGSRLVSLPFADHCDPLCERIEQLSEMLCWLSSEKEQLGVGHIEIRPLQQAWSGVYDDGGFRVATSYRFHVLDLAPSPEEIFSRFDKDCIQRRIRRSERECLTYEEGRDPNLLQKFYSLLVKTRKRHGVPPQPLIWFQNLIDLLRGNITIRVASKANTPVAAILTLASQRSVIYKYGASDSRFNNLAGTAYLFWKAIRDAKAQGAETFDMGRSDATNSGLIRFKSNWAAEEHSLNYWRFPVTATRPSSRRTKMEQVTKRVFGHMPEPLCIATGRAFYKHIG